MWALINTEQPIDHFHIALFPALERTHCTLVTCGVEWVTVTFHCEFWYPLKWCAYSTNGRYMAGATWNCCCLSIQCVCTIQPCTSFQCHFIQSHRRRMHECLTLTCHLHFWQNDQDLLLSAVSTQGWNRYQHKSAQEVDPRGKHSWRKWQQLQLHEAESRHSVLA